MELTVNQIWEELTANQQFKEWRREHPNSYISHFFRTLNPDYSFNGSWEVGLYDPDQEKIMVFVFLGDKKFSTKPADEVFKEENSPIEKLDLHLTKYPMEKALADFRENLILHYPAEVIGQGFVVLQTIGQQTFWSVTFITRSFKFLNFKIDVRDGKILNRDLFALARMEKGERNRSG
jgi:hypothetical protein